MTSSGERSLQPDAYFYNGMAQLQQSDNTRLAKRFIKDRPAILRYLTSNDSHRPNSFCMLKMEKR